MFSLIIQRSWYRSTGVVTIILLPLSAVFCALSSIRRGLYRVGLLKQTRLSVPVIIVGNINVGGTGKTPLTIAITQFLQSKGYTPGVICRGYGGTSNHWPQLVTPDSNPEEVGDEAVLISSHCQCPVSAGPDRVKAAQSLIREEQCNIIVSDDGLQHLALMRDIEIVVIDGERRFGNGLCLPAGPLRELPSRLNTVDMVVTNGRAKANEHEMTLRYTSFEDINGKAGSKTPSEFAGTNVEALAGIGNNERFFNTLEELKIAIKRHPYPDHYAYQTNDVMFNSDLPVLMTEKDAVKCKQFSLENAWYLKVNIVLGEEFYQALEGMMAKLKS